MPWLFRFPVARGLQSSRQWSIRGPLVSTAFMDQHLQHHFPVPASASPSLGGARSGVTKAAVWWGGEAWHPSAGEWASLVQKIRGRVGWGQCKWAAQSPQGQGWAAAGWVHSLHLQRCERRANPGCPRRDWGKQTKPVPLYCSLGADLRTAVT